MSDTNNGGPAFPVRSDPQNQIAAHEGMTLRDYFAGQALAGWLASFGDDHSHPGESETAALTTARHCYAMADAMLVARNVEKAHSQDSPGPETGVTINQFEALRQLLVCDYGDTERGALDIAHTIVTEVLGLQYEWATNPIRVGGEADAGD